MNFVKRNHNEEKIPVRLSVHMYNLLRNSRDLVVSLVCAAGFTLKFRLNAFSVFVY